MKNESGYSNGTLNHIIVILEDGKVECTKCKKQWNTILDYSTTGAICKANLQNKK